MDSHPTSNSTTIPRADSTGSFKYAIAGFHLLIAFLVINAFFPAKGFSFEKVAVSLLYLSAVICFALQIFVGASKSQRIKFDAVSNLFLVLLIVWYLVTIIRGFETRDSNFIIYDNEYGRIFTLLANPDVGGLVWLLPFAAYIGRQPGVLQALQPTFRLHTIIGSALSLWAIFNIGQGGNPASVGVYLLYAAPIALLTNLAHRSEFRFYIVAEIISGAASALALSSRTGFILAIGVLLLTMTLHGVRTTKTALFKAAGLVVLVAVLGYLSVDYMSSNLSDDMVADTRTFLWEEMNDDFDVGDWIFGRGALGVYYSPYFAYTNSMGLEGDWMYRQVNEIGYLHIALKAGAIGVLLFLLIFVRATYKAFRLPNKRFAIGMTLFLGMHLVEMIVIGQASFQPYQVMLWILVGIAISKKPSTNSLIISRKNK